MSAPNNTDNPKAAFGRAKRQYQFIPAGVLDELADSLAEGAQKYGPFNWRDMPIAASDYYDASLRHIQSYWGGEDIDPDSGVHHISKAIASLTVLRDAMIAGTCRDDRPLMAAASGARIVHPAVRPAPERREAESGPTIQKIMNCRKNACKAQLVGFDRLCTVFKCEVCQFIKEFPSEVNPDV